MLPLFCACEFAVTTVSSRALPLATAPDPCCAGIEGYPMPIAIQLLGRRASKAHLSVAATAAAGSVIALDF